jgi:hypothetical protein
MVDEIGHIVAQVASILEDTHCDSGSIDKLLGLASKNH